MQAKEREHVMHDITLLLNASTTEHDFKGMALVYIELLATYSLTKFGTNSQIHKKS